MRGSDDLPELRFLVSASDSHLRLDSYLALHSHLSRSQIQRLIEQDRVLVGGNPAKKDQRVKPEEIILLFPMPPQSSEWAPEPLPLSFLYEDESVLVLNKEAGMVVHPSPGHASGTLVHALLHRCPDLAGIGGVLRPGIVHRLDKDTSGLMVVAKNEQSHEFLSQQFKSREVRKQYLALVLGEMRQDRGRVEVPIGRRTKDRKKMGVRTEKPRAAATQYSVLARRSGCTLIEAVPETGRTHQIRVHLAHIGHPVWGDPLYGGRRKLVGIGGLPGEVAPRRQMLHAWQLGFVHPRTAERLTFEAPLPPDFCEILTALGWQDEGLKGSREDWSSAKAMGSPAPKTEGAGPRERDR